MAGESSKSADAQLASNVADKALENTETSKAADTLADSTHDDDEDEEEADEELPTQAEVEASGAAKKKKKPKKKKKKAAGDAITDVAQAARSPPNVTQVHDMQSLLNQLALQNKDGKSQAKAPEDYKFWNTQPVPKFKTPNLTQTTDGTEPEGAILPDEVCRKGAKAEPDKLGLTGFEWCLLDLNDEKELEELYMLLEMHYVEDTDGSFRFKYGKDFLRWALQPPGWRKEWHIGVRVTSKDASKKGKLVAFIAGIPVTLKVGDKTIKSSEINFLVIHRTLRHKRLAPVLIKEVTRSCFTNGIYQALYTAGTILPTPITTCRYFHRSLDWPHLYKTGFSQLPPNMSEMRMKVKYRVETKTSLKGLRPMKKEDVPAVKDLLVRYLERFHLRQEWSTDEIEHWLCGDASKGVVYSYVVEDDKKRITDFMSYYLLESTVLRAPNQTDTIRAAYLYYYATDAAFPSQKTKPAAASTALSTRLQVLISDLLVLAKQQDFHVFNAVTILDNPLFLKELKFEPGDGKLHYYLYNYKTKDMGGGVDERMQIDTSRMGGVGVVML